MDVLKEIFPRARCEKHMKKCSVICVSTQHQTLRDRFLCIECYKYHAYSHKKSCYDFNKLMSSNDMIKKNSQMATVLLGVKKQVESRYSYKLNVLFKISLSFILENLPFSVAFSPQSCLISSKTHGLMRINLQTRKVESIGKFSFDVFSIQYIEHLKKFVILCGDVYYQYSENSSDVAPLIKIKGDNSFQFFVLKNWLIGYDVKTFLLRMTNLSDKKYYDKKIHPKHKISCLVPINSEAIAFGTYEGYLIVYLYAKSKVTSRKKITENPVINIKYVKEMSQIIAQTDRNKICLSYIKHLHILPISRSSFSFDIFEFEFYVPEKLLFISDTQGNIRTIDFFSKKMIDKFTTKSASAPYLLHYSSSQKFLYALQYDTTDVLLFR